MTPSQCCFFAAVRVVGGDTRTGSREMSAPMFLYIHRHAAMYMPRPLTLRHLQCQYQCSLQCPAQGAGTF